MGIFDFGSKAKIRALSKQITDLTSNFNSRFTQINSLTQYPTFNQVENSKQYATTDDVFAIINLIAATAASVPLYNYIKQTDGTLIDANENDALSLLLEMPLEGMSKYESLFAIYANKLLHGEYFLYKERPEAGPNAGKVIRLHLLPPENIAIKVTTDWPFRIISYQFINNNISVLDNIPPEDIIHSKYFNPQIGIFGTELRGLSPLTVLLKRLTRIDSNNDASTAQLQNGGVPGIVFEKGPVDDVVDISGQRKKKFYEYLSNSSNKGAPYFASGELGYIQLGLKLADLEVAELSKIDFKKLCNVFKVSDRLFNNDATGSEVSDKGARIGLYTNAVIPEVMSLKDTLNRSLVPDFKDKKYCIDYDTSEIQELQTNYGEMVTWMAQAYWLTPNEKREMMKFEEVENPLFNEFLLPSGLQTIEDIQAMNQLPLTGDYGQNNNS